MQICSPILLICTSYAHLTSHKNKKLNADIHVTACVLSHGINYKIISTPMTCFLVLSIVQYCIYEGAKRYSDVSKES